MKTLAILDPLWRLLHLQPGWRRTTGVLRYELTGASLVAYTHPDDVAWLLWAQGAARRGAVKVGLRVGYPGEWEPVVAELGPPTREGMAVLTVEHATGQPLPRSRWWVPERTYAALPALPCTQPPSA